MNGNDQEEYLKNTPLKEVILRGIKKLITEATSVKFLLLIYICIGIWHRFITEVWGLSVILLIVGVREVQLDALAGKLIGRQ